MNKKLFLTVFIAVIILLIFIFLVLGMVYRSTINTSKSLPKPKSSLIQDRRINKGGSIEKPKYDVFRSKESQEQEEKQESIEREVGDTRGPLLM